jgi:3-methyladenine DNA glycosylase AlkC
MAEPLKHQFSTDVIHRLARDMAQQWPRFDREAFTRDASHGFLDLELMPRAAHLATALQRHLPPRFAQAAALVGASLGPPLGDNSSGGTSGMTPFFYLPHVLWVARNGLDDFDAAMPLQHALTQRFTAEFSLGRFIERDAHRSLQWLQRWVSDPSEHVRRLVSEGTRPRLPWAPRLKTFLAQPAPVLDLLSALKDDPSSYVRRSVANHLNDLWRERPDVAMAWLHTGWQGAPPPRQALIRHALRTAIKQGDAQALTLLGFAPDEPAPVLKRSWATPPHATIGASVVLGCELHNPHAQSCKAVVDIVVHYVKAQGATRPKVFKLAVVELAPGASQVLTHRLSLRQMTTRHHYPGQHEVDIQINGVRCSGAAFHLTPNADPAT